MSENDDRQAEAYKALRDRYSTGIGSRVPHPQKPERNLFDDMEAMKLALGEANDMSQLALQRTEEAEKKADRLNRQMLFWTALSGFCAFCALIVAVIALLLAYYK